MKIRKIFSERSRRHLHWKYSNYFHTPAAVEKISIKTNCNKFYSARNKRFSIADFSTIVKCVIKCSWDDTPVVFQHVDVERGRKYIIIVYVFVWCLLKICCFLHIFLSFEYSPISMENLWPFTHKKDDMRKANHKISTRILMVTRFIYVCLEKV